MINDEEIEIEFKDIMADLVASKIAKEFVSALHKKPQGEWQTLETLISDDISDFLGNRYNKLQTATNESVWVFWTPTPYYKGRMIFIYFFCDYEFMNTFALTRPDLL